MADVDLAGLSAAIIQELRDVGLRVGDSETPDGAGVWQGPEGDSAFVAYVKFDDISGGEWDGSMADRHEAPDTVYQAMCVSGSAHSARVMADTVRRTVEGMLRQVVAGRVVTRISFDFGSENTVSDQDVKPSVFWVPVRFRLQSWPT